MTHVVQPVNGAPVVTMGSGGGGGGTPISHDQGQANLTFGVGAVVNQVIDGWSGTETPFSYAEFGSALAGSGLTVDSAGGVCSLVGTAAEGSYTGVVIRGTDQNADTDDTNAFNVTVQVVAIPGTGIPAVDGTGAPGVWRNGLPYTSTGFLEIDSVSAVANMQNGYPFTANGRVAVAFLGTIASWNNGLPFDSNQKLVVREFATDSINAYTHGIPFDVNSRVVVDTT